MRYFVYVMSAGLILLSLTFSTPAFANTFDQNYNLNLSCPDPDATISGSFNLNGPSGFSVNSGTLPSLPLAGLN